MSMRVPLTTASPFSLSSAAPDRPILGVKIAITVTDTTDLPDPTPIPAGLIG
jgi:hypothetical protein